MPREKMGNRSLTHRVREFFILVFGNDVVLHAATSATILYFFDAALDTALGTKHRSLSIIAGWTLLGGCVSIQLVLSGLLALIDSGAKRGERIFSRRVSANAAAAGLFGLLSAGPFFLTGQALASGDWISQQSYAGWIAPLAALFGMGSFFATGWMRASARGRAVPVYAFGCGAAAAAVGVLDARVYPGIYPSFHFLAFGLQTVFVGLFAESFIKRGVFRLPISVRVVSRSAALILAAIGIFLFVSPSEEIRSELLSKRRIASHLLRLAPGIKDAGRLLAVLKRIEAKKPVSFERRPIPSSSIVIPKDWNIILVIVDAMRADTLPPNRKPKQAHAGVKDTPFLDRWIKDTFQFQFAYSPSNMTDSAMPSIFSGLYPSSLRKEKGTALSRRLSSTGRLPVAVVNQVFRSPKKRKLKTLTDGFKETKIYSSARQTATVPTMLDMSQRYLEHPFFAWFHFYCLHNPYFANGEVQKESEGSFKERYRRALRWLDGEMKKWWDGLVAQGLKDKSVIVLTADHGEGLGDRGLETHGSYVFDEETHVPLYIRVPGYEGGRISSTVSLVDLAATLMDLQGVPAKETDGTSLVPLMDDVNAAESRTSAEQTDAWNRDYYLENASGNYVGVVHGRDKLVYFKDGDTFFRFDLKKDPREKRNLFKLNGETDQLLLARLVFYRPDLFVPELEEEKTGALFDRLYADRSAQATDAAALLAKIAEVKRKR